MPSTSAKQHRFMEAIAHNRAFAKKVGVPQSVGKEFAAADKGKKFVRGGINKQDTRHGKMDMPFNKLNRFAGMKAGGVMKKGRRYEDGGEVGKGGDVDEGIKSYAEPQKSTKLRGEETEGPQKKQSFSEAFKDARASGDATFMWNGKKYSTEMAKPAARSGPNRSDMAAMARAPAVNRTPTATTVAPARATEAKEAAPQRRSVLDVSKNTSDFFRRDNSNWNRFAKGGMMKESKAMVGKEVAFMKKKGAPASMIKHEKAEMSAMRKGGMAKYARGGGIESRGKTKGTIVKMAAGGLAGGHKSADGIAQRGKTKARTVTMKGGGYC